MSEERSDEESGWEKAWIHEPPPRFLAALGMTPLLYDVKLVLQIA
jgi:hypothetical protein